MVKTMKQSELTISAGEFKAKCLKLMDDAKNKHVSITITKHGVPIARLVPYQPEPFNAFGCMKDTVTTVRDIIDPIDVQWDAEND